MPPLDLIGRNLRRFGDRSTCAVSLACGGRVSFYHVTEYPRSGGTWLAQMLADYLGIPLLQHNILPPLAPCVIHNHWRYRRRLRRVFYLVRDGRDVVVSMYFFVLNTLKRIEGSELLRRRLLAMFGLPGSRGGQDELEALTQTSSHLASFIEGWGDRPFGCRVSWPRHVGQWAFDRPGVVTLRYEDLLDDCIGTLARALPQHTGEQVDMDRLVITVGKYSFERQSGRTPGQEDRAAFLRKGVAGDWRNHFTRPAARLFESRYGIVLRRLGYEKDSTWVDRLPDRQVGP